MGFRSGVGARDQIFNIHILFLLYYFSLFLYFFLLCVCFLCTACTIFILNKNMAVSRRLWRQWTGKGLKVSKWQLIESELDWTSYQRLNTRGTSASNTSAIHTVRKRKLQYFGLVVRARNLCTHILEGRIAGDGPRGRPARRWTDDIRDWSGMSVAHCTQTASNRQQCRKLVHSVIPDTQHWGWNATTTIFLRMTRQHPADVSNVITNRPSFFLISSCTDYKNLVKIRQQIQSKYRLFFWNCHWDYWVAT